MSSSGSRESDESLTAEGYPAAMLPFGPRLNTVFASRWKALLWAGGVLLTAYCTVPAADNVAGKAAEQPAHHNPWALDPDAAPAS